MKHVLAIDEGTTGVTSLVVSELGEVVGRGYREITQYYPQPGWVEHDASEIAGRTIESAREAIAAAGVVPDACGITNQRETVVLWDRNTGDPVGKAIVWQDRRTATRCLELAPRQDWFTARTGLRLDPYFSATKLEHLLSDAVTRRRAESGDLLGGTIDSWLIWKLSGGAAHVTDPTNASRTLLYDIEQRCWSEELCRVFGVPRALLPDIHPSAGHLATTDPDVFGIEIPISGVAGDQQAALYGQGCWRQGDAKNTYGTGAFLLMNTGAERPEGGAGLLTTIACDAEGGAVYALEASIFIAGAAVQWLRDGLRIIASAAECDAAARSLEDNGGVYFVPALVGLGAPHWEPAARGTLVGITGGTSREHFVRAALEAMAYGTAEVLEVMQRESGTIIPRLRADGGAAANDWLMQFQANLLGVPVERPAMLESTALGAAGLAGIASGVWSHPGEFLDARRTTTFVPDATGTARAGRLGWDRAVRAALHWARDSGAHV